MGSWSPSSGDSLVSTPHLHDYFLVSSLLPSYIFVFCYFKILLIEILLYTVRQIMYVSTPQLHDSFPYQIPAFLPSSLFFCMFKIHIFDNTISDLCLQQFGASTGYSCLILDSSVLQDVYSFQEILETLDEDIIW